MIENAMTELFGKPIHSYTRAQALEDGFLVDAGMVARESGFKCHVALTRAVWDKFVKWDDSDQAQAYQDQSGRLWDVLWMGYCAIKRGTEDSSFLLYELFYIPRDGKSREAVEGQLKMTIGGGDDGEMVITIMLPGED